MSFGKVICLTGAPGEGKTTFIKKFNPNKREIIAYMRIGSDFEEGKIIKFTNFKEFLKFANTKKNAVFYIDEAFTCLPKELKISLDNPQKIDNQLADFLVNSRKLNNFIFIIFHSLKQIPLWLLDYTNWLVRYNTNDLLNYQAQRFISFPEIVQNLIQHPELEKYKPQKIKLR